MKKETVSFKETRNFSKKFLNFIENESLSYYPKEENILETLKGLNFSKDSREVLFKELDQQYENFETSSLVKKNIKSLLSDNTFTVTTGHQLNIFTGPMYVIYKIVSAIKLSNILSKKYPKYNFVPIYWMASEDHDFEEIKSFHSNGKTYTWDIKSKGPVGNLNTETLKNIFNENISIPDFFKNAYSSSSSLSEAVRKYMNYLFGEYGLITIDPNSNNLKKNISDIIVDDIVNNTIEKIEKSSDKVSDVYVRKINFFYQESDLRERIDKTDKYNVLSTSLSFTEQEIKDKIKSSPELFSPNVITRCLFQQRILPNVCYLGGPAEIVYWESFKKFFDNYNIPYPVLVPRDFALLLTAKVQKLIKKLNLSSIDLFEDKNKIENKVLAVEADASKNFKREIDDINKILNNVSEKFEKVDPTMKPHVLATAKKMENRLLQIERRYINKQKKNNHKLINQISELYMFLHPDNSIQERKENLISFYDLNFIENLMENLDPLDLQFKILKK